MERHTFFWLGAFISALIAVPLAFGISRFVEGQTVSLAVFAFGMLVALLLVLLLLLCFRDAILRKVFGTTQATLTDVSAAGPSAVA
jgi:hypothetical protein